jgi:D-cysteine desulfhydrase
MSDPIERERSRPDPAGGVERETREGAGADPARGSHAPADSGASPEERGDTTPPSRASGPPEPDRPALFRWFPALRKHLPWIPLARVPTPVERIAFERFGDRHWIKRDDRTGALYGGNKVRKLEWILADARRQGAERLITIGAEGTHHGLATALYGRELGFRVTLCVCPQPRTPHVEAMLRAHREAGAEIRRVPRMEMLPIAALAARWAHRGEQCYAVAAGGSDPRGTLGFVSAALELAEQVRDGECPEPEAVHLAMGTMGTAAGLAIGFALAGLNTEVRAVRITSRLVTNERGLRALVARTLALLKPAGAPLPSIDALVARIRVNHRCIGRGYGHTTEDAERAAELFGEAGVALDPTYTAKAAVGFLDGLERAGERPKMFWMTLGEGQ